MQYQRLHFLGLCVRVRMVSPLPRCIIFPQSTVFVWAVYSSQPSWLSQINIVESISQLYSKAERNKKLRKNGNLLSSGEEMFRFFCQDFVPVDGIILLQKTNMSYLPKIVPWKSLHASSISGTKCPANFTQTHTHTDRQRQTDRDRHRQTDRHTHTHPGQGSNPYSSRYRPSALKNKC